MPAICIEENITYVNTWLKLKQESAGWPSWCQTVDQKREYILRYQKCEGIRLDISQIAESPGRKAKAKLMLKRNPIHVLFSCCHSTPSHPFFCYCSFWDKFGERNNKPTTVTVKDPAHLFSLLSDAALNVSTLRLCTDDILEAVYTSVYDNAVKGQCLHSRLHHLSCTAQTLRVPPRHPPRASPLL